MADQDDDSTTTPTAGEGLDALPQVPPLEGDDPADEPEGTAGEPAPDPVEETVEETPPVLTADEATLAAAAIPTRSVPSEEPAAPRYGAQFSSPEPTTVTARPRRRATRPALSADPDSVEPPPAAAPTLPAFITFVAPADVPAETPAPRRRGRRTTAETPVETPAETPAEAVAEPVTEDAADEAPAPRRSRSRRRAVEPEAVEVAEPTPVAVAADEDPDAEVDEPATEDRDTDDDDAGAGGSRRRRRGRRGRGRGRTGEDSAEDDGDDETRETEGADTGEAEDEGEDAEETTDGEEAEAGSTTRRRRRRRRRGESSGEETTPAEEADERPERAGRGGRTSEDDVVRGISGSTRLEAKRQRRRDGRDTGRRRAPILSESEFLARREAVDRAMVIRQQGDRTQIAVLEDDILVEHYVTQAQATSFAGNVYLGRVQNVLPSMEAAFVDIGKGRNAVVYAGEVNWDAAGLSGKQRSIEQAFKSGDKILCQVTKDPIGHKGARLTQQINLPGRFLVYVPGGSMTGISRKLPDNERQRLKDILKKIVPEDAGVIIRTAAEGASEEELTRDVARLQAQWDVIQRKAESSSSAPALLYGEPDLAIRVIRDVFNEDFKRLVVSGDDAWDTVEAYVAHVSPELSPRLQRYTGTGDVFHDLRVDEQLAKALDRKVYLPSGGSLVIDRTEAMTVVDVNTGKFVGSGGNLEQTVTRNNIEAAEEIVRQLRLRDIGGIIVIDFIDMVLESNRDLVLRRLTECLGRDRTKHQVAEVTSLGLVQMTRKRVGQGLLEVFSEPCEHCRGRGVMVHLDPVDPSRRSGNSGGSGNGSSSGNGSGGNGGGRGDQGGRQRGPAAGGREPVEEASVAVAEPEDAPVGDAESGEIPQRSGGRRNRGRRNRGQSGEARAAEDAAIAAGTAVPDADDDTDTDDAETAPVDAGVAEAFGDLTTAAADEGPAADPVAETAPVDAPTLAEDVTVDADEPAVVVVPVPDEAPTAPGVPAAPEPALGADAGAPVPVAAPDEEWAPEDDEVLVADEVPAADPASAVPVQLPAEPAPAAEVASLAEVAESAESAEVVPVAEVAARPRRRRAASRPAGPPAD